MSRVGRRRRRAGDGDAAVRLAASASHNMARWIVVTGASAGIGKAIALEAAARGYNVVVAARRQQELEELAAQIKSLHKVDALAVPVDLAGLDGCRALHSATSHLSVAVLVANAGFAKAGPVIEQSLESMEQMMTLNMAAVALLCRLYGAEMAASSRGTLILTSSLTAFAALPGAALYAATRSFVHSFAAGLAIELASQNVSVRCLVPGSTDSEFAATSGIETSLAFNGPLFRPLGVVVPPQAVARAALDSIGPPARGLYPTLVDVYPSFLQHVYAYCARNLLPRGLAAPFAAAFFGPENPLRSARALLGSLHVLLPAALLITASMPLAMCERLVQMARMGA